MPTLTLINPDSNVAAALAHLTLLDYATVATSSATEIVMTRTGIDYTLTGTGFTTTVIGGVTYINSGTVDRIDIAITGVATYSYADLGVDLARLRNLLLVDGAGTDNVALERLFLALNWTIHGTSGVDQHTGAEINFDGVSFMPTGRNTCYFGDGADQVFGAGLGRRR